MGLCSVACLGAKVGVKRAYKTLIRLDRMAKRETDFAWSYGHIDGLYYGNDDQLTTPIRKGFWGYGRGMTGI